MVNGLSWPRGDAMRVSVLGATGSIGASTLDLIGREPAQFAVQAVTAKSNAVALAALAKKHGAKLAVVSDPAAYAALKSTLAGTGIEVAAGPAGLEVAAAMEADCTVAAIVGVAGLAPALIAVARGQRVALANKECLVSAGRFFMANVRRHKTELLTIDSEHSGVMQVLETRNRDQVVKVTLTASGGPFRTWTAGAIATASLEQALQHPNWTMGPKITIDSATMMNKGLELIEAQHLFDLAPVQLDMLVHAQSIVHALVEYSDGSVLAQLAQPDMRLPIALALNWPRRRPTPTPRLNLATAPALTFEAADETRFPCIRLSREAMQRGGGATAALNAANEVAVAAFLAKRCKFGHIAQVVSASLDLLDGRGLLGEPQNVGAVMELDGETRRIAADTLAGLGDGC